MSLFAIFLIVFGIALVIGAIVFLMYFYEKDGMSLDETSQVLGKTNYNRKMTRASARRQAKSAMERIKALVGVENEVSAIGKVIDAEAIALKATLNKEDTSYRHLLEQEKLDAEHLAYLAVTENTAAVARMGTQFGLTPDTIREVVLEWSSAKAQAMVEQVKVDSVLAEYGGKKAIDFSYEEKMAELDKSMADVANLLPEHQIEILHSQLSQINSDYVDIQHLPEGDYKTREMQRIRIKMETWESNIRERTKRLF